MKRLVIILIIIKFGIIPIVSSQKSNLGIPFVIEYPKSEYKAGTQNWDITQDDRGVIYFANNEGLMEFDGLNWSCFPLPNKTIVRSIAIDSAGLIYAGGQNEIGFFSPDQKGKWIFQSLKILLPEEERNFEDVWDIVVYRGDIYFRTSKKLFRYHSGRMEIYNTLGNFNYLGIINQRLVVQDNHVGLSIVKNEKLEPIQGSKIFTFSPITSILPIGNGKNIITTLYDGIYIYDGNQFSKWGNEYNQFLIDNRVYSAILTHQGHLALGTVRKGLIIMSLEGKIIYSIDNERGLLNNNVLALYLDKDQHIWAGLDNGINYILSNSPFTRIIPDGKTEGAGYDLQISDNRIYFGTSNGLYYSPWKEYYSPYEQGTFEEVKGAKGQVWGLDKTEDDLFLSHHSGSFVVKNDKIIKNYPGYGVWFIKPLLHNKDLYIAGTYNGLAVYARENGIWQFRNKLEGFNESSRFVEEDDMGNIWVAHPYKGIYKIRPDDNYQKANVTKYGETKGLQSDLSNHVFNINGELIFCSEQGIYHYDYQVDSFLPYTEYDELFPNNVEMRRLFSSPSGNIWYVSDEELGVIQVEEKSIAKEVNKRILPNYIRDQMVDKFEKIYPVDEENIFIGSETGFIHYNPSQDVPENQYQSIIRKVTVTSKKDSIISYGIYLDVNKIVTTQSSIHIPTLSYSENALRFEFSITNYTNATENSFQYYLEGLDDEWSDWTKKPQKEYTNLPHGEYVFQVRAKNTNGQLSDIASYAFIILPPWYKTNMATWGFGLLGLLLVFLGGRFYWNKYYYQKEKVVASKKEIDKLKNERLEAEIAHKNRELVSSTIHLQHKNEIFLEIKYALEKIKKESKDSIIYKGINKVINMMEIEESSDIGWEQFIAHFNEIHPGFFEKLKKDYPDLTPKDMKLCAYLRMNLNTKEIASLMNNTVRGVEGGRYRLRKKLNLSPEDNLTEFIQLL